MYENLITISLFSTSLPGALQLHLGPDRAPAPLAPSSPLASHREQVNSSFLPSLHDPSKSLRASSGAALFLANRVLHGRQEEEDEEEVRGTFSVSTRGILNDNLLLGGSFEDFATTQLTHHMTSSLSLSLSL
jgi:hypothetical protein